jgi:hypothetical protein
MTHRLSLVADRLSPVVDRGFLTPFEFSQFLAILAEDDDGDKIINDFFDRANPGFRNNSASEETRHRRIQARFVKDILQQYGRAGRAESEESMDASAAVDKLLE